MEVPDAGMLKKATYYRYHANIFRQPFDAGSQRADTAHDQLDAYARCTGGIERCNDARLYQGIHLGNDLCTLAALGQLRFMANGLDQALMHVER